MYRYRVKNRDVFYFGTVLPSESIFSLYGKRMIEHANVLGARDWGVTSDLKGSENDQALNKCNP